MKQITLTDGTIAKVDDCDYKYLNQYTWSNAGNRYPTTTCYFKEVNGMKNRQPTTMHRLIMGCAINGMVVDHINRDPKDNRRSNLRVVSVSINTCNSKRCDL